MNDGHNNDKVSLDAKDALQTEAVERNREANEEDAPCNSTGTVLKLRRASTSIVSSMGTSNNIPVPPADADADSSVLPLGTDSNAGNSTTAEDQYGTGATVKVEDIPLAPQDPSLSMAAKAMDVVTEDAHTNTIDDGGSSSNSRAPITNTSVRGVSGVNVLVDHPSSIRLDSSSTGGKEEDVSNAGESIGGWIDVHEVQPKCGLSDSTAAAEDAEPSLCSSSSSSMRKGVSIGIGIKLAIINHSKKRKLSALKGVFGS
jgi:hypothetical protein